MMILLGNFLRALTTVVQLLIDVSILLLLLRALMSWLGSYMHGPFGTFVYQATEPILGPIRKRIPPIGVVDISALVVLLVLIFLRGFLLGTMSHYAERFLATA